MGFNVNYLQSILCMCVFVCVKKCVFWCMHYISINLLLFSVTLDLLRYKILT